MVGSGISDPISGPSMGTANDEEEIDLIDLYGFRHVARIGSILTAEAQEDARGRGGDADLEIDV